MFGVINSNRAYKKIWQRGLKTYRATGMRRRFGYKSLFWTLGAVAVHELVISGEVDCEYANVGINRKCIICMALNVI